MSWRKSAVAVCVAIAIAIVAVVVAVAIAIAVVVSAGVDAARLGAVHTGAVVDYSRRWSNALTFR